MKGIYLIVLIAKTWAYISGPPSNACSDMAPRHGRSGQTSSVFDFFDVSISNTTVKSGESVSIRLVSKSGDFKGFLVQVEDESTAVKGSFSIENGMQSICSGGVSHANASPKSDINLEWTATGTTGNHTIFATIVRDYTTYWVKSDLGQVTVVWRDHFFN